MELRRFLLVDDMSNTLPFDEFCAGNVFCEVAGLAGMDEVVFVAGYDENFRDRHADGMKPVNGDAMHQGGITLREGTDERLWSCGLHTRKKCLPVTIWVR